MCDDLSCYPKSFCHVYKTGQISLKPFSCCKETTVLFIRLFSCYEVTYTLSNENLEVQREMYAKFSPLHIHDLDPLRLRCKVNLAVGAAGVSERRRKVFTVHRDEYRLACCEAIGVGRVYGQILYFIAKCFCTSR